jgi:hypothetical protein
LSSCEYCRRHSLLYGSWSLLIWSLHFKIRCMGAWLYSIWALYIEKGILGWQLTRFGF